MERVMGRVMAVVMENTGKAEPAGARTDTVN